MRGRSKSSAAFCKTAEAHRANSGDDFRKRINAGDCATWQLRRQLRHMKQATYCASAPLALITPS